MLSRFNNKFDLKSPSYVNLNCLDFSFHFSFLLQILKIIIKFVLPTEDVYAWRFCRRNHKVNKNGLVLLVTNRFPIICG